MQSAAPGMMVNDDWRHASTPTSAMKIVTGLQTIEDRQEIKVLTQAAKFKRLQDHPMHERMNHPTIERLKRSNFLQHSRILEKRNHELQDHMPKSTPVVKINPSWKRQFPRMCTKVPGVVDRCCPPEPERKSLTLEYVNTKYPEDQWTHAYTDGFAEEGTQDGGGGAYIRYSDGKAHITIATGKYSTNFKVETEALQKGAIEIRDNLPRTKLNDVIFTDALSVLNTLQNPRQRDLSEVETPLVDLAAQTNLTLQYILAYSGIQGNEQADRLAREGDQPDQEERCTSYTDEQAIIKTLSKTKKKKKKRKQQHPNFNQSDNLHKLCPCNADIMTAEHLLQHCQQHDALKRDMWPEPNPLRVKLYGNLEKLRRTVTFVRATGISV